MLFPLSAGVQCCFLCLQVWNDFFREIIKERHNGYDTAKDKHPTDLDFTKVRASSSSSLRTSTPPTLTSPRYVRRRRRRRHCRCRRLCMSPVDQCDVMEQQHVHIGLITEQVALTATGTALQALQRSQVH